MVLILLLGNQCLFAQEDTTIYTITAEMPYLDVCKDITEPTERKRCADDSLRLFIIQNITYPEKARELGITGTCVVEFVILENGTITEPTIKRSISEDCDEEVLKGIKQLANYRSFVAARNVDGQAVKYKFLLPVKFRLPNRPKTITPKPAQPLFTTDEKELTKSPLDVLGRYILHPKGFSPSKFEEDKEETKSITLNLGDYNESDFDVYLIQPENKGYKKMSLQENKIFLSKDSKNSRILVLKKNGGSTFVAYQELKKEVKEVVLEFKKLTTVNLKEIIN